MFANISTNRAASIQGSLLGQACQTWAASLTCLLGPLIPTGLEKAPTPQYKPREN